MGADIHFYVEVKHDDGTWEMAPRVKHPCRFCNGTGKDAKRTSCQNCGAPPEDHAEGRCLYHPSQFEPGPAPCSWAPYCVGGKELRDYYDERNYDLFGVLAGVRGDVDPEFTEDRGLPADLSHDVREEHDTGYHSETWYTLAELLDYFRGHKRRFAEFWKALQAIKKLHKDAAQIRVVVWFDS
jgi:hypothetical protein